MDTWSLSFVIPVKDEEFTIFELIKRIKSTVELNYPNNNYEIIIIDDGSNDRSWEEIITICQRHPDQVKALKLRKNFGKSCALALGFKASQGDIIITLDADLQDNPEEIPKLIDKIQEGYDIVSGWKINRQDPLSKTIPSLIFNKITSIITGIKIHDFNCGFKAYRKDLLKNLSIYGELHRYIPVLAHDLGYKIAEVEVKHNKREFGSSKFGRERYVRGFVDLLTVIATTRYLKKPGHLFGGIGLLFGAIGFLVLLYLSVLWFFGSPIGTRPLFFLGVLLTILAIQLISLGILAELVTRNSSLDPAISAVSEKVNINNNSIYEKKTSR